MGAVTAHLARVARREVKVPKGAPTNSCAAVIDGGRPLVIPTDADKYVLPSVVAFTDDGRLLVGREAKRHSVTDAANTVVAAKRLMGIAYNDPRAKAAIAAANYKCVEGPSGDVRVHARGRDYALPEVGALIIAELKRCAEAHLGERIEQAVITCPAYFNDFQRQATRDRRRRLSRRPRLRPDHRRLARPAHRARA